MLGIFFAIVGFVIVSTLSGWCDNPEDHYDLFMVNLNYYSNPNCTGDCESIFVRTLFFLGEISDIFQYDEENDLDPICHDDDEEESFLSARGLYCEDNIELYVGGECLDENLIFEGEIIGCQGPILDDLYFECSDYQDDEDGSCYTNDELCFSVESVLEKKDGSLVALKDIEVNDIVKTLNENNEIVETLVLDVHIHDPIPKGGRISNLRKLHYEIINLDLGGDDEEEKKNTGGILHITTNHFLYSHPNIESIESMASEENLKLAGEVKVGDYVIVMKSVNEESSQLYSLDIAKITRITNDKDTLQVGTLYTSQGRYFVDGVLVSDYSVSGKSKFVDAVEVAIQKNFDRFWEIVSFCTGGVIDGDFAKEITLKFVENIYHPLLGYFFG